MIDLETLSTRDDAAVISIGVVVFDEISLVDSLHLPLTMEKLSGHLDPRTIEWWMEQSKEAQLASFAGERMLPHMAAFKLWELVDKYQTKTFWANDPHFDYVILRNWWRRYREDAPFTAPIGVDLQPVINVAFPFGYNTPRSYRTIVALARQQGFDNAMYDEAKGTYVAHNAMEDAAAQARVVLACEKWLSGARLIERVSVRPPVTIEGEVIASGWRDGTKSV